MDQLDTLLKLLHLLAAVFMAAPLYALITVNERGGFGRPIQLPLDRYLENLIRKQPLRCYVYLGTLLITGLLLVVLRGWGLSRLWSFWPLAMKSLLFLGLVGLLSYVHFGIQPRIEGLLAQVPAPAPAPADLENQIWRWRKRRKALAATCLFLVMTTIIMGIRVMAALSPILVLALLLAAALFTWRVHRSTIPYGWF